MPNPYGRPKTYITELRVRLPNDLFAQLALQRPLLYKPGQPGVFQHGALSAYITSLIKKDLTGVPQ